jgi:hypothetical protein
MLTRCTPASSLTATQRGLKKPNGNFMTPVSDLRIGSRGSTLRARVLERAAADLAAEQQAAAQQLARLEDIDAFEELKNMNKQSVNRPQKVRRGGPANAIPQVGGTFFKRGAPCRKCSTPALQQSVDQSHWRKWMMKDRFCWLRRLGMMRAA